MSKLRGRIERPHRPSIIINLDRVAATYQRAIADEQTVLALWSNAKEYQKKNVAALAFSPAAEEAIDASLKNQQGASANLKAAIADVRVTHMKVLAEHAPKLFDYKPSEFIAANLQEAWMPYAEMLLTAAGQSKGHIFAELMPHLKRLGFADEILALFRRSQKRKYFLQQTPASTATLIVTRRLPNRIGSEETVRRAGKRLYSRIRSGKKTK